jgi:NAD(P)-dependent dehydrogenase (short-subunit alcohol dehydrogenase family)
MVTAVKTVVITGASSAIGRAAVARMAQSGWSVFAAVRKEQDGDQLRLDFGASVTPVMLDVRERPSVGAAAERVASLLEAAGLDGLVNVAGVGKVRPVDIPSIDIVT